MSVTRTSNATIIRNIEKMNDSSVTVGWFPEAKYTDGTPVAEVARKNEYGGMQKNQNGKTVRRPPRPFVRPAIHQKKEEWEKLTEKLFHDSIEKGTSIDSVMEIVGGVIEGEIKANILALVSPKLAAYTIKKKGFDKPLIDTALMWKSIKVKVGAK